MSFGYPHVLLSLYECVCGAEIVHEIVLTDEYDSGDGGELDIDCPGCGKYYKRCYRITEAGGRYKKSMAKRFEWSRGPAKVTVVPR